MNRSYAGIDIGGTSVKWIIVNSDGHIVDEGKAISDTENIVEQVAVISVELRQKHPNVESIGVITPGLVDEDNGRVIYASNLALKDTPLAERVVKACALPTVVGHDGRSAGLAEGILGAGKGANSYVMIPIGTGISAAIWTGKHMVSGAQFSAGEIGHVPIVVGGDLCSCGQRGCLEVYASARGIARQYAQMTGKDIGTRAIEKRLGVDPIADQVWEQALRTMALALAQLTFTIDPERIIIGGGLSRAGEIYMSPLRSYVSELMAWREPPKIVTASLGDMAGRWGAVILACQLVNSQVYRQWEGI